MEAKELAPERTPQTAMKAMLIRGCLRVRSTRGSSRSRKWWWSMAGASLGMIATVGVRVMGFVMRPCCTPAISSQAMSVRYLDAAALGVNAGDLNRGLCQLARPALQFTTSDGDRWYL